uniref:N-carbamoylputrescine amidase n=1 Tax=Rhizophora mucronata TaxID=61149 RepID=A0A2P2LMU3_RHIMU
MRLPIKAKVSSISINYGYRIIMCIVGLFKEANRNNYTQLLCQIFHPAQ